MKEFELYVKDACGEYHLVDTFATMKEAMASALNQRRGSQIRMFSGRILVTLGEDKPIRTMVVF